MHEGFDIDDASAAEQERVFSDKPCRAAAAHRVGGGRRRVLDDVNNSFGILLGKSRASDGRTQ